MELLTSSISKILRVLVDDPLHLCGREETILASRDAHSRLTRELVERLLLETLLILAGPDIVKNAASQAEYSAAKGVAAGIFLVV
jgi:hypothetical protein